MHPPGCPACPSLRIVRDSASPDSISQDSSPSAPGALSHMAQTQGGKPGVTPSLPTHRARQAATYSRIAERPPPAGFEHVRALLGDGARRSCQGGRPLSMGLPPLTTPGRRVRTRRAHEREVRKCLPGTACRGRLNAKPPRRSGSGGRNPAGVGWLRPAQARSFRQCAG
jgi:hypothetical protein